MAVNIKKSVIAGIIAGIAVSLVVVLCAKLNGNDNELIQSGVNFFAGVPAFIAMAYNLPSPQTIIVYFAYWALVGAIFGLLAGVEQPWRYIPIFILLVALIIMHRTLQVRLGREITDIAGAVLKAIFSWSVK
ncbi:MAG: hypothetical protein Q8R48_04030 [Candidatus Omnitrophota bacterium]|nr:hypothetical protein [Candidatus Omnitrophota bacterium]